MNTSKALRYGTRSQGISQFYGDGSTTFGCGVVKTFKKQWWWPWTETTEGDSWLAPTVLADHRSEGGGRGPCIHPLTEWIIRAFSFPAKAGPYLPTQKDRTLSWPGKPSRETLNRWVRHTKTSISRHWTEQNGMNGLSYVLVIGRLESKVGKVIQHLQPRVTCLNYAHDRISLRFIAH